jgi:ABC-type branched-subunit amino acid transport system substrate-binding protein
MPLTPFGKKARDNFKGTPTLFAALGVEAYAITLNAIDRCSHPAERECINNQFRATADFTGTVGKITIGPNGKAQRPLCINSIKGGRSKFIVKVY